MIIDPERRNIYIAGMKVASTSIESVLASPGNINLTRTEFGKHMPLSEVVNTFSFLFDAAPIEQFDIFGSIRNPVDWMRSLYTSHKAEQFANSNRSTRGVSFASYVRQALESTDAEFDLQIRRFELPDGRLPKVYWIPMEDASRYLREFWFRDNTYVDVGHMNASYVSGDEEDFTVTESDIEAFSSLYCRDFVEYLGLDWENRSSDAIQEQVLSCARSSFEGCRSNIGRTQAVTKEMVIDSFRALLGRDPESNNVISDHMRCGTLHKLLATIIGSNEYRSRIEVP